MNSFEQKTAIVTGCTGQDGSYLCDLLLSKNYKVVGLKRRTSLICTDRLEYIYNHPNFKMEYFDLNDASCFWKLFHKYNPDEIYNLAAQSHVRVSFDVPENTVDGIAMGTLRMLNAMKDVCPKARFYQASSSEMYGDTASKPPFDENTPMRPASPYACAKLFAHNLVRNYRESYGLHLSSGILFNHESPLRGETFVTRKITMAASRIKLGLQNRLELGNLEAYRDWGYAPDYCEGMWRMLQQPNGDDYVLATGETHSVKEFLEETFEYAKLDYKKYVVINERLYRPQEVPYLLGNFEKAKKILGWKPKVGFKKLVQKMYNADYQNSLLEKATLEVT